MTCPAALPFPPLVPPVPEPAPPPPPPPRIVAVTEVVPGGAVALLAVPQASDPPFQVTGAVAAAAGVEATSPWARTVSRPSGRTVAMNAARHRGPRRRVEDWGPAALPWSRCTCSAMGQRLQLIVTTGYGKGRDVWTDPGPGRDRRAMGQPTTPATERRHTDERAASGHDAPIGGPFPSFRQLPPPLWIRPRAAVPPRPAAEQGSLRQSSMQRCAITLPGRNLTSRRTPGQLGGGHQGKIAFVRHRGGVRGPEKGRQAPRANLPASSLAGTGREKRKPWA